MCAVTTASVEMEGGMCDTWCQDSQARPPPSFSFFYVPGGEYPHNIGRKNEVSGLFIRPRHSVKRMRCGYPQTNTMRYTLHTRVMMCCVHVVPDFTNVHTKTSLSLVSKVLMRSFVAFSCDDISFWVERTVRHTTRHSNGQGNI